LAGFEEVEEKIDSVGVLSNYGWDGMGWDMGLDVRKSF
jgi:hypothetical protein